MFLASIFARSASAAPPAPPPLAEGSAVPVPGQLNFEDVLRGLNPLHHLPVVGMIYREATGETIQPVMRVLGGGLLGGPLGMLSSALMAALDEFRAQPPADPPAPRLAERPPGPPDGIG